MSTRLYSAVIGAARHPAGSSEKFTVNLFFLEAVSYDEATGKALNRSFQEFPQGDGWTKHNALVVPIPQDLIDKYATPVADVPHRTVEDDRHFTNMPPPIVRAVIPDAQRGVTPDTPTVYE